MDVKSIVIEQITKHTEEANKVAETVAANSVSEGKQVHDLRESSNDEKVAAFRGWLEQANAAINAKTEEIDAYIKSNLLAGAQGEVDLDALKVQYGKIKEEISAAKKYLKVLGTTDEELAALPDLKTLRGTTAKAGGGGGKRPRLDEVKVDGKPVFATKKNDDGTVTESASFTVTAQHMSKVAKAKVTPKMLQEAAFGAAGTDDLSSLNGAPFDFYFEAGEGENRRNFHVEVTPRDNNAAEEKETPASE